jgi:hypothetical protein
MKEHLKYARVSRSCKEKTQDSKPSARDSSFRICRVVGAGQPIESVVQVSVRRKFKREPACLLHLSRSNPRIFPHPRQESRRWGLQFDGEGVWSFHRTSSREQGEDSVSPVEGGKSEEGAKRYTGPVASLCPQSSRPRLHGFGDWWQLGAFGGHGSPALASLIHCAFRGRQPRLSGKSQTAISTTPPATSNAATQRRRPTRSCRNMRAATALATKVSEAEAGTTKLRFPHDRPKSRL